jgi:hypothetical protein
MIESVAASCSLATHHGQRRQRFGVQKQSCAAAAARLATACSQCGVALGAASGRLRLRLGQHLPSRVQKLLRAQMHGGGERKRGSEDGRAAWDKA